MDGADVHLGLDSSGRFAETFEAEGRRGQFLIKLNSNYFLLVTSSKALAPSSDALCS